MVKSKCSPRSGSRTRFRVGPGYVTRSEPLGSGLSERLRCGVVSGAYWVIFPPGPAFCGPGSTFQPAQPELVKGYSTREKAQDSEGKPASQIRIPTL